MSDMDDTMPETLAIRKSKETWANYLCRSGLGGRDDTNYYREDLVDSKDKRIAELEAFAEWLLSKNQPVGMPSRFWSLHDELLNKGK